MISKITTHASDSLALLAETYKRQPRIAALLTAFVTRAQEAEDGLFPLLTLRSIDDSFGAQLDLIGLIVDQPRLGLSDTNYRQRLRARIYLNKMSGTIPQVLELFRLLTPESTTMTLLEAFKAGFKLTVDQAIPDGPSLAPMLQSGKPTAVLAILEFQAVADAAVFSWFENSYGLGWDENGDGTGGTWAEALS